MRTVYLVIGMLLSQYAFSQPVRDKLANALLALEKDPQFKHAVIAMYVADKTGMLYEKNAGLGLAPASTQKIITGAAAYELLGQDFTYKTFLSTGGMDLNGYDIHIHGSGDPTFGSWRYGNTKEDAVFKKIYGSLQAVNIKKVRSLLVHVPAAESAIPGGWVWEDVANYYGAGAYQLNWRENQYDLSFNSFAPFTAAKITGTRPGLPYSFNNSVQSGAEGSGDNAFIYFMPGSDTLSVQGTIPPNRASFTISGAMPDPSRVFLEQLKEYLADTRYGIPVKQTASVKDVLSVGAKQDITARGYNILYTHTSPSLDSIIYWFLQKSINLYGEALVKTIARERYKAGATGLDLIRDFWKGNGIEKSALKIMDGSGLSPANRVTAKALVQVLEYAKTRKWFNAFYKALPDMNGIQMKSGYIGGVRSYTGYVKSKSGSEYAFAFIINNFDGSATAVKEKMYRVLDLLK